MYLVDNASRMHRVRPEKFDQVHASWSPNGDSIYFGSSRSGRFEIWKVAAAGVNAEPVQVTVNGGYDALESPDGRTLFYVKHDRPGLWRATVARGDEALIADSVIPGLWALSDRGIHFVQVNSGGDGETLLMFLSYAGGKPRTIGALPKGFNRAYSGISISSDGRRLLFCALEHLRSDLMLLDNFR
jgi:Tol biopolymer transport system component